jgi:hypothetical protein
MTCRYERKDFSLKNEVCANIICRNAQWLVYRSSVTGVIFLYLIICGTKLLILVSFA